MLSKIGDHDPVPESGMPYANQPVALLSVSDVGRQNPKMYNQVTKAYDPSLARAAISMFDLPAIGIPSTDGAQPNLRYTCG